MVARMKYKDDPLRYFWLKADHGDVPGIITELDATEAFKRMTGSTWKYRHKIIIGDKKGIICRAPASIAWKQVLEIKEAIEGGAQIP